MSLTEWFRILNKERLLFLIHKVTGWILTLFIIGHVIFVHEVVYGSKVWDSLISLDSSVIGKVILIVVVISLIFHGLNGIRIMLIEIGVLLTKPREQEYPYTSWLNGRKHLVYVSLMGIIGIILSVYAVLMIIGA